MKTFMAVLTEHREMVERLADISAAIEAAGAILADTLAQGGKILLCGNGGSAADCQHIAAELVVRYEHDRVALPALALTTDSSILTAHSNDVGFESVFSRQVEAFGQAGDCLVAISTSGNSPNIIKAAIAARAKGLKVIVMTGGTGGALLPHATQAVVVPSNVTARIQEAHILIGHWWCGLVESRYAAG